MNNLEFIKFLWNGVVQSRLYSIYLAYSFFFTSPSLAGGFICCTSTSCTSPGFILAMSVANLSWTQHVVHFVNSISNGAQGDKPVLLHGYTVLLLPHSCKSYLIFGLQEPLRFQPATSMAFHFSFVIGSLFLVFSLNIKDITFAETATTTDCDFLWDLSILFKPFLDES